MRVTGTHPDRQALRVVLVEDDEVPAELLGDFLAGHPRFTRPRVYAHAGAALPGIREFAPHAVLVDLRLAGSSGLDCIRRIRAEGLRTHVLAFTSSTDEDATLIPPPTRPPKALRFSYGYSFLIFFKLSFTEERTEL
jgi:CheY-like chemotaxis protein